MMEWISIKNKSYPYGNIIIVVYSHLKNKSYSLPACVHDEGISDMCGELIDQIEYEVTHWMPIPEPPDER